MTDLLLREEGTITASDATRFFGKFWIYEDRFSEAYGLLEDLRMAHEPNFPDCRFQCAYSRWSISGDSFELYGESWFRGEMDGSAEHSIDFDDLFDRFPEWKRETEKAIEEAKAQVQRAKAEKAAEERRAAEARDRNEYERLKEKYSD